jgi:hypothetical protein
LIGICIKVMDKVLDKVLKAPLGVVITLRTLQIYISPAPSLALQM